MVIWRCRVAALMVCAASAAGAQELPSRPISLAGGRITLGTDLSVSTTPQDDRRRVVQLHRLRAQRAAAAAAGRRSPTCGSSDRVSFLTELRSENGGRVEPYALYVRLRPWRTRAVDIQAGRIPPTFGAFSRRDYGAGNPLDRVSARLPVPHVDSAGCGAGHVRRRDPHARAGLAAELSHWLARRRAGLAARHRISVGYRCAGPGRRHQAECERGGDQWHGIRSRALATTTAASRFPGAFSGSRPSRSRSAAPRRAARTWPTRVLASATSIAGNSRSAQQALGLDAEYSRDHWLVRSEADLESVAGSDAVGGPRCVRAHSWKAA